jgi:acyl-CoA thioester hydrolase
MPDNPEVKKPVSVFTSRHRVVSYELDAWGHVNNAVYLNYLEKARNDFMLQKGLEFKNFAEWGKFPVVRRASVEFIHPATSGDRLLIEGWISSHTAASFTLSYIITNEDTSRKILTGETFHVFVDKRNRPTRIPPPFLKKFIAYSP